MVSRGVSAPRPHRLNNNPRASLSRSTGVKPRSLTGGVLAREQVLRDEVTETLNERQEFFLRFFLKVEMTSRTFSESVRSRTGRPFLRSSDK